MSYIEAIIKGDQKTIDSVTFIRRRLVSDRYTLHFQVHLNNKTETDIK